MTTTNQSWDPDAYARNARFVSDLGAPVLEPREVVEVAAVRDRD